MRLKTEVGKYFAAADVVQPLVLTIKDIRWEDVRSIRTGEIQKLLIAEFEEVPKKMVLKRTIIDQLTMDFGTDESDEWIGKKVELYAVDTTFAGKPTKGLRARAAKE